MPTPGADRGHLREVPVKRRIHSPFLATRFLSFVAGLLYLHPADNFLRINAILFESRHSKGAGGICRTGEPTSGPAPPSG
jgi:hypothetical protein